MYFFSSELWVSNDTLPRTMQWPVFAVRTGASCTAKGFKISSEGEIKWAGHVEGTGEWQVLKNVCLRLRRYPEGHYKSTARDVLGCGEVTLRAFVRGGWGGHAVSSPEGAGGGDFLTMLATVSVWWWWQIFWSTLWWTGAAGGRFNGHRAIVGWRDAGVVMIGAHMSVICTATGAAVTGVRGTALHTFAHPPHHPTPPGGRKSAAMIGSWCFSRVN
jgi:hypothetical protein